MWSDAEVVKQANRYERLLVRVPEAYWLVSDYGVTRPGVLVLTPEGRQVDAIAVKGADPESDAVELAVTLELAADAVVDPGVVPGGASVIQLYACKRFEAPDERATAAPLMTALQGLPGVGKVAWKGTALVVTGARLWLRPKTIVAIAKELGFAMQCTSHREASVAVEQLPDTPTTMARCKKMERVAGVVLAVPVLARREVRFLVEVEVEPAPSPSGLVQAAGYTLRVEKK